MSSTVFFVPFAFIIGKRGTWNKEVICIFIQLLVNPWACIHMYAANANFEMQCYVKYCWNCKCFFKEDNRNTSFCEWWLNFCPIVCVLSYCWVMADYLWYSDIADMWTHNISLAASSRMCIVWKARLSSIYNICIFIHLWRKL